MKTKIAEHAGTCLGVENAIKIAFEAARRTKNNNIYILGELVHNPDIVKQLETLGVQMIEDVSNLKEGDNLIIRAHGEKKNVYDHCRDNKIRIIDCTCPFVKRTQTLASELEDEGYKVILIGDKEHPEVRGIAAHISDPMIVSNSEEIKKDIIKDYQNIGILSQTTQKKDNFRDIISSIVNYPKQIKIHNTICSATSKRQDSAIKLCNDVDLMLVIGGKNSANTKNLYELCSDRLKTYWIPNKDEIKKEWFNGVSTIGVTAGASTPSHVVDEVVDSLESL